MDFILSSLFFSFILTSFIIELTPGPNMAYLAILSASDGRKAGFAATTGVAIGLLIIGIAAALGVATIISNSMIAYQALRIGGIAYLLWLAWDSWKPDIETSLKNIATSERNIKFFKRGLIVNILNPKAAVFYVAVLPRFISIEASVTLQAITLTISYVLVATLIHTLIVTLAGTARQFLEDTKRRLIARRIMALALVGIAAWFALTTV